MQLHQQGLTKKYGRFQSMHPIKDATITADYNNALKTFQSMHPIKDATVVWNCLTESYDISIHAPYKGCNKSIGPAKLQEFIFQSMHPIKDATVILSATRLSMCISIHAPYKGCNIKRLP